MDFERKIVLGDDLPNIAILFIREMQHDFLSEILD